MIAIGVLKWHKRHAHLNLSDVISAIRVGRLVFMTRAYGGSGLETQPKGLKPLIQKWVFTQIFSGFQRFLRVRQSSKGV